MPARDPDSQAAVLPSKKYFMALAMFPKRVGEPRARPSHSSKSECWAYGEPSSGIVFSVASHTAETLGTVRRIAWQSGTDSIPSAMSSAKRRVAPARE